MDSQEKGTKKSERSMMEEIGNDISSRIDAGDKIFSVSDNANNRNERLAANVVLQVGSKFDNA